MNIKCFHFGVLRACCMVLWEKGPDCVVVDASFDTPEEKEALYRFFQQAGLKPLAILLTHAHFDHIEGVKELSDDYGGLPVFLSFAEAPVIDNLERQCRFLGQRVPSLDVPLNDVHDGDVLTFGDMQWEVLATPGHSPGGVCYLNRAGKMLISGDTLFAGTIGRTDLGNGDYDQLMDSIMNKLMPLDGDIEVFPGHGQPTSIGVERSTNPFLQPFNQPFEEEPVL